MIRLALVEDDPLYVRQLDEFIKQYKREFNMEFVVKLFSDGEDIVEEYKAEFDIILMDIQMQFMDGMTAAQKIRGQDKRVVIIFITNMVSYAVKGYEVDALDYIVKPITYYTFSQKLSRAIERVKNPETQYITIPVPGGVKRLNVERVYYIESQSHTMYYHTADGNVESKGRLEDLEKKMESYGFYRSNKGYLVNMNHVDGIQDGCCVIHGEYLPVSRRKKSEFIEKISKIL